MNLTYVDVEHQSESPFKATVDGRIIINELDLLNDLFPEGFESVIQLESDMAIARPSH